MALRIKEARHLGGNRLAVRFWNGRTLEVDLGPQLAEWSAASLLPLREPAYLASFQIARDGSALTWESGATLSADTLRDMAARYRKSFWKAAGRFLGSALLWLIVFVAAVAAAVLGILFFR